ncbi:MAG: DUF2508 family protein [Ruminococcaceae bacterium]|nr:DUF2508 family protein [Oscillospiraceae bacterium]
MKNALFKRKKQPDPELERLKAELYQAQDALQQAYHHLDLVLEPELVESCIYQISAIQSRCNYLIRAIKARHGAGSPAPAEEGATWI